MFWSPRVRNEECKPYFAVAYFGMMLIDEYSNTDIGKTFSPVTEDKLTSKYATELTPQNEMLILD